METPAQTVGALLGAATEQLQAAGSETARLDAEVLLAHVLGVDRSALMAHPEAPLGSGQLDTYRSYLTRRSDGEPVAYIRGMKEFYGVALSVDARVLIPRPETETLVVLALERIREDLTGAPGAGDSPYLVWDIGTGSAAIPVAIAAELRRRGYGDAVRYHLSDASADAMAVALVNAVSQGVADLMTFSEGDLTDVQPAPSRPVDLLTANLPYIASADVPSLPVATSYEPAAALDGGGDGLDVLRRLLPELPRVLAPAGAALLEIGADQVEAITNAASHAVPDWAVTLEEDLSGSPRVVRLERAGD